MSKNDFDKLVPFYDFLKRMVFGNRLDLAAGFFLNRIGRNSKVLVIGPGSGNILKEISAVEVFALDKSKRFIDIAKQENPEVEFMHNDFLRWESTNSFDWVVCPFFLDVFAPPDLRKAIVKIWRVLRPDGKLIVTDFQVTEKIRHALLQQLMHLFFRWTVGLESNRLQDIQSELSGNFKQVDKEEFGENIFSGVYQKKLPKEP